MTPFPETEIMTIKRLEVALRKMDFKLLKDGAYKLHEKFHSGHRFEYIDLLKEIYANVLNNPAIPGDIKDILTPTIEDILKGNEDRFDIINRFDENAGQNRVSSLTSLSYNTNPAENSAIAAYDNYSEVKENELEEEIAGAGERKFSAFDAFSPTIKPQNTAPLLSSPFEEFKDRELEQPFVSSPINNSVIENSPLQSEPIYKQSTFDLEEAKKEDIADDVIKEDEFEEEIIEKTGKDRVEIIEETIEAAGEEAGEEIKENAPLPPVKKEIISIFYYQDYSNDKVKNIIQLRELILKASKENISLNETAKLISEINTQADTNVLEIKSIIEQLKSRVKKANLITNSQSSNFFNLFRQSDINYNLFNMEDSTNINFMPIFGLSNFFVCPECNQKYLALNNEMRPLVLECPKCKYPMFADLWAPDARKCEINLDYYNSALYTLSQSTSLVLIHPSLEDKIIFNLLKNAFLMSNSIKDIYILDKDINIRESYKNIFLDIKEDVNVNIQLSALEDFFNSI